VRVVLDRRQRLHVTDVLELRPVDRARAVDDAVLLREWRSDPSFSFSASSSTALSTPKAEIGAPGAR